VGTLFLLLSKTQDFQLSDLVIKVQQVIDDLLASLEISIDDATDPGNDTDDARRSQPTPEADGNSAAQGKILHGKSLRYGAPASWRLNPSILAYR